MDIVKLLAILQVIIRIIELLIGMGILKKEDAGKVAKELVKAMITET